MPTPSDFLRPFRNPAADDQERPVSLTGRLALAPYAHPELYGAQGDGIADDTAALQRAAASGRPVWMAPNRRYRYTGRLELPRGAYLMGPGELLADGGQLVDNSGGSPAGGTIDTEARTIANQAALVAAGAEVTANNAAVAAVQAQDDAGQALMTAAGKASAAEAVQAVEAGVGQGLADLAADVAAALAGDVRLVPWVVGSGAAAVSEVINHMTVDLTGADEAQWHQLPAASDAAVAHTAETVGGVTGSGLPGGRTVAVTGPGASGGVVLARLPAIAAGSQVRLHIPAAQMRAGATSPAVHIFFYVDPRAQVGTGGAVAATGISYYRHYLDLAALLFGEPFSGDQGESAADVGAFFDTAGRVETCTDNGDGSVALTVSLTALVDIAAGAAHWVLGTVGASDTVDWVDGSATIDAPTGTPSLRRGATRPAGLEVADATADGHRSSLPAVLQFVAAKPSSATTVASITGTTGGVAGNLVAGLVVESDGALRLDVSEDGGATTVSATAPAGVWKTDAQGEIKIEVAAAPAEVWVYLGGTSLLWVPLAAAPSAIDSYLIAAPQPTAPADADGRGTAVRAGSICRVREVAAIEAIRLSAHEVRSWGAGFVAVIAGADTADEVKAGASHVESGGNGHTQISQAIADGARALVAVGTVTCSAPAIIDAGGDAVHLLGLPGASLAGDLNLDGAGGGIVRLDVPVTGTVTDTGGRAVRPVYTANGKPVTQMTQAQFSGITPDPSTLYAIVG